MLLNRSIPFSPSAAAPFHPRPNHAPRSRRESGIAPAAFTSGVAGTPNTSIIPPFETHILVRRYGSQVSCWNEKKQAAISSCPLDDRILQQQRDWNGKKRRSGSFRMLYSTRSAAIPRVRKILATASPILLLGVEAPAVTPIRTGPLSNIHPAVSTSAFEPSGRWRMVPLSGSIASA